MTGASASVSFVSWMSRTSGAARASHCSTFSWRALSELTFQVAIRIGSSLLQPPTALAVEIERGGVGDRHDGHRPCLDRVRDDEIHVLRDRADHVQRDDPDPEGADLVRGIADIAPHY